MSHKNAIFYIKNEFFDEKLLFFQFNQLYLRKVFL